MKITENLKRMVENSMFNDLLDILSNLGYTEIGDGNETITIHGSTESEVLNYLNEYYGSDYVKENFTITGLDDNLVELRFK